MSKKTVYLNRFDKYILNLHNSWVFTFNIFFYFKQYNNIVYEYIKILLKYIKLINFLLSHHHIFLTHLLKEKNHVNI